MNNTKILEMESLALDRHFILESFSLLEDIINVIIFQRYTLSFVDDFIHDLMMSAKTGFGWKMELLDKLITQTHVLSKEDWGKLSAILWDLSAVRNYFAHTPLGNKEVKDGKEFYRGVRKITYEVNLDEKRKVFDDNFDDCLSVLKKISEFVTKDYDVRERKFCEKLKE